MHAYYLTHNNIYVKLCGKGMPNTLHFNSWMQVPNYPDMDKFLYVNSLLPALINPLLSYNYIPFSPGFSSKQVRTELQTTRELLRNAVNRAPSAPLRLSTQLFDASLPTPIPASLNTRMHLNSETTSASKSVSGAGAGAWAWAGGNGRVSVDGVGLQGPDPMPPGFDPLSVAVADPAGKFQMDTAGEKLLPAPPTPPTPDPVPTSAMPVPLQPPSSTVAAAADGAERPSSGAVSAASASVAAADCQHSQTQLHRVAIIEDNDDEEDDDDDCVDGDKEGSQTATLLGKPTSAGKKALPATPSNAGAPSPLATGTVTGIKGSVVAGNAGVKGPAVDLGSIVSSYDLERALIQARESPIQTGKVLKAVTVRQVRSFFRNLMEPNVLYLLLRGVGRYYGRKKQQWKRVFDWFHGVATGVGAFALLYSLLPAAERAELEQVVIELRQIKSGTASVSSSSPSLSPASSGLDAVDAGKIETLASLFQCS